MVSHAPSADPADALPLSVAGSFPCLSATGGLQWL
ncbi:hypothetical protein ABID12_002720 [Martelella mangrovi]|uniref:Uncharacterized protein n=1 Tax=Martelella mangrovi TaxID=1397477 RepID=A0ABV2ICX6_9HYPH